jgi:prolyl-tRNA editing enzyme YbaK/EbsC (Cys-tRNA(Pro) deacylase)
VIDIESTVKASLDATGLPYELLPCDPDFADTVNFCARYGYTPEQSVNTIIVVGKSEPRRYVACAVTAATRLDVNGAVRRRLGVRRTSFASADETREMTGMMIGGVTAFGLPPDIPLWVDTAVMEPEFVILGGGSRSLKVKVSPKIFERMANTTIVPELALTADGSRSADPAAGTPGPG